MAHAFAQAMKVSPWEALLGQLYLLQGQVAWLTAKVGEAPSDDALMSYEPGVGYAQWKDLLEARGDRLTRVAKMAIDAGIAERMVMQIEDDAQRLYAATKRAAATMGLGEDRELELVAAIAREYATELAAAQNEPKQIEGQVME
jgi:hypothetical protein